MYFLLLWSVIAAEGTAGSQQPSADQLKFFESRVRPVLVEHCYECHGPEKQWGGLRLDAREAMLNGGDSGPAVLPGRPDDSLLIRAIRHEDDSPQMPEGGKLGDQQIADLAAWVRDGAAMPDTSAPAGHQRDPDHWAFQPRSEVSLPAVSDSTWIRSPIDRFILARMEAAGVRPAPQADRRTLIRRVTYDLTGLPPTPAEIDAFQADPHPDAYARLVDRLLASPAYGERWGRRWLDVVRYADSNGLDENVAHGNAWRYRDYVVQSMNADKPFDQFIIEQLAGDLLPFEDQQQQHEQLIATGLLAIGPKVLAEVDQAKMRMDIVDEQIDCVGRVFLGLTLGCARCHDHKFDPIDAADYYALAGVFKSTRTMETYTKVARWHEHPLPSPAAAALKDQYEGQVAAKKQEVEQFIARANQQVRERLGAGSAVPENLEEHYDDGQKAELAKLRAAVAELEKNPPELPAAMGVTEDTIADVAVHLRGNPLKLGDVVRRRVPPVIRGAEPPRFTADESGRRELAEWLVDSRHPLTARVLVNRVWRWHFGTGLVRTTDNFGLLGEAPTHPELLDWLATRLISEGWSMKSLHRLLLMSSTYQQTSRAAQDSLQRDPDNHLFSRSAIRRLEAEEIRDALLAVSGQLDRSLGGSLLQVKNRGYLFDHTSIDKTDYTSRRRSLYLPVIRNHVYNVFQLLDFPDPAVPTGDRATTTVAPQALLMMNSSLVMEAAEHLARGLLVDVSAELTDEQRDERIRQLYEIAYGRPPTEQQCQLQRGFLSQVQATFDGDSESAARQLEAWSVLCHTILASNEFIYLQ